MNNVSRRTFVKSAIVGGVGMALTPGLLKAQKRLGFSGIDEPSDLVLVHDSMASHGASVEPAVTRIMIDEGIKALTGESTVGDAWMSIFPNITSEQVIGIKVNAVTAQLPVHPQVVFPLIDSLIQMTFGGYPFPENNIIIWDRSNWELTNCGYTINTGSQGPRCFGTSPDWGYGSLSHNVNGVNCRFSRIFEELCDHVLNVGVLKNHGTAGVSLSMKNHYGTLNNVDYLHGNYCDPYIPAVNAVIRDDFNGKDRLKIIDGIFGAHYGGPGGGPTFVQNELIMSVDRWRWIRLRWVF